MTFENKLSSLYKKFDRFSENAPFIIATIITIFILTISFLVYWILSFVDPAPKGFDAIDKLGSYISGIFGFVGVVWICATFRMQMKELAIQRQELQMQREASQSAAISFRSQMVISLHDRAIAGMSDHIRSLLQLILKDNNGELNEAREIYNSGDRYAYINLALSSGEFNDSLVYHLKIRTMPVMYLLNAFQREAENLRDLTIHMPEEVKMYLYSLNPISTLYSEIQEIIKKTTDA